MEANKLMIGDYFYRPDCVDRVVEIHKNGVIGSDPLRGLIPWSEIKPITLTVEILKKNEFRRSNDRYLIGNSLRWEDGSVGIMVDAYESPQFWRILTANYVHELQHILRMCRQTEMADNLKI
jgi:hypothetical protein